VFNRNPGGLHRVSLEGEPPQALGIAGLGQILEKSVNADGRQVAFGISRNRTELWRWER
jgi:hypothetical protein